MKVEKMASPNTEITSNQTKSAVDSFLYTFVDILLVAK